MTKFLYVAALLVTMPAFAQQQATQPQPEGTEGSSKNQTCQQQANAMAPTTAPSQGANSGTDPRNNGGSTGWSGSGLGGSHTGTTPGGSSTASHRDVEQPPVATGLDLAGTSANTAAQKC